MLTLNNFTQLERPVKEWELFNALFHVYNPMAWMWRCGAGGEKSKAQRKIHGGEVIERKSLWYASRRTAAGLNSDRGEAAAARIPTEGFYCRVKATSRRRHALNTFKMHARALIFRSARALLWEEVPGVLSLCRGRMRGGREGKHTHRHTCRLLARWPDWFEAVRCQ